MVEALSLRQLGAPGLDPRLPHPLFRLFVGQHPGLSPAAQLEQPDPGLEVQQAGMLARLELFQGHGNDRAHGPELV